MKINLFILFICTLNSLVHCHYDRDQLYKVLEIPKNATKSEIKTKYKNLVKIFHPDKNGNDNKATQKFAEIRDAYEILGNEERRKMYDKCGIECVKTAGIREHSIFDFFNEFDIFESSKPQKKGEDISIELQVTLEEIYSGSFVEVTRNKAVFMPAEGTRKCNCKQELVGRVLGREFVQMFREVCEECPNLALTNEESEFDIEIEKGIADNHEQRFFEEGEPMADGEAGDLIVKFKQLPHPVFRRNGNDLHAIVNISLKDALIGFNKELIHLDGHAVEIVKSDVTYHGEILRLEGEGMPLYENFGAYGDLLVTFNVEFPKITFNEQQKKQIESLLNDS